MTIDRRRESSDEFPVNHRRRADNREVEIMELLFFAYRDFTSDADAVLREIGFGRAHHRVLHFVDRNPGMRVGDLLGVLRITKQSLSRVLSQLKSGGFIAQTRGAHDQRERLLYTTSQGHELAWRLLTMQSRRMANALAALPPGGFDIIRKFLVDAIDPEERDYAKDLSRRNNARDCGD